LPEILSEMISERVGENDREALEAFKQAIRQEYERKIEALRETAEQEFSSLVAARRMEVERKVQEIRQRQKIEFNARLALDRQEAVRKFRSRVFEAIEKLLDQIEAEVAHRLEALRMQPEAYGPILSSLVKEALDALALPAAVVRVKTGEGNFPVKDPRVVRIEESEALEWGGAVVFEAEKGTPLVDNSLQTRWERLRPILVESLSGRLAPLVDDVQQPLPELRVP
jgi:vacuolar-type H+-ATPase subunit E/Vma4